MGEGWGSGEPRQSADETGPRQGEREEELDRLKSEFFASVGQELRAPLALILGPAEKLLGSPAVDERDRRDIETVTRNARLLLRLVDDILDACGLEAGRVSLDYAEVDMAELVRRAAAHFDSLAADRAIHYQVIAESVPAQVDADRLERVFLNLLASAFEFTPEGGAIRCSLRGEPGRSRVVVEVADSGPGVPPAHRQAVFERFRQVDGDATRRSGGTGLGLAIARDFVALHGGTLTVGDAPEGGAVFVVELPTAAPATASVRATADALRTPDLARAVVDELRPVAVPARPAPDGDRGARPIVLVIEDSPEMNRFLCENLAADYHVVGALDGETGLVEALSLRPDLVVTDAILPEPSGTDVVRAIRSRPELAATPILVLSAQADHQLRVQLLREGASDYVVKPFAFEEVRARVGNLVAAKMAGERNRQLAAALRERKAHLTGLTVELEQMKGELESLTYAVSHDLRAPLRTIYGFSHALLEDYPHLLDDTGQNYLGRVRAGAERMGRLIDDLLSLSRVVRAGLHDEPVDLAELAREVAEDLGRADPIRRVGFRAEPGPPARGDRRLLRNLLENLLGNAWKFTGRVADAVVDFGWLESDGRVAYFVRDNGAGFDMRYAEKLFAPFHRLHSEDEFPGTGIGLATVQRIVRRHGGRIWAHSTPGGGATFFFTLAAPAAA